jgi:hypothetical protein
MKPRDSALGQPLWMAAHTSEIGAIHLIHRLTAMAVITRVALRAAQRKALRST